MKNFTKLVFYLFFSFTSLIYGLEIDVDLGMSCLGFGSMRTIAVIQDLNPCHTRIWKITSSKFHS